MEGLSRRDLASLAKPKFLVVTGKGGVGRTTVSSALALSFALRGLRTVVIEVSATQNIPAIFGVTPLGYRPVECRKNLFALQVTWQEALREYGLMKLRFKTLYRLVFENPFVSQILPAIPGVAEILVIGKVLHVVSEGISDIGKFDKVILDAPATGHGIALFGAPFAISEAVVAGPLREDSERLKATLLDAGTTGFCIVATPEEMPVAEATEVYEGLAKGYGLPFKWVFMNGMSRHSLHEGERRLLARFASSRGIEDPVGAVVRAALFMASRHEIERFHLERLGRKVPLPIIALPELSSYRSARERVEKLAEYIDTYLGREVSR